MTGGGLGSTGRVCFWFLCAGPCPVGWLCGLLAPRLPSPCRGVFCRTRVWGTDFRSLGIPGRPDTQRV